MSRAKEAAVATIEPEARSAMLGQLLALPDDLSPEALLDEGVRSFSRSGYEMARAGECFRRFRNVAKSDGGFLDALEKRGIGKDHAYRAMQLAELLERLPPQEAKRIAGIPYTRALQLANAEPEVIAELIESGDMERVAGLSVRGLSDEIRRLNKKLVTTETKLETIESKLTVRDREAAAAAANLRMPIFANVVRQEGVAVAEAFELGLNHIETVLKEHLEPNSNDDALAPYARMAAGTLYHGLRGAYSHLQDVLHRVAELHPEVTSGMRLDYHLNRGELDLARPSLDIILGRHKAQIKNRDTDRKRAKQRTEGGRGRPAEYVGE